MQGIQLSRSRPYQKNDNRIVEQKNSSLVRSYLGYDRLDGVAQTLALNQLYDKMWVYYNLFQPVMRMQEKTYVPQQNTQSAHTKRRYDVARTPFDRLCETDAILPEHKAQLDALRRQVNPRQLRRDIYASIDDLFALPGAQPDTVENVYETLWSNRCVEKGERLCSFSFNRTIIRS